MGAFDPISALIGGVLIGLASALLMLLNGRIAVFLAAYSAAP